MTVQNKVKPDQWVDLYGDDLFRYAHNRVKEDGVAEELVQETFLAAIRSKERFQGLSSEKTWLFSILKHKIIDHYRSQKKEISTAEAEDWILSQDEQFDARGEWRLKPQTWVVNPEKAYEFKEFLDILYHCLAEIPRRLSDVFVYREMEGLTTQEICKIVGVSATNCGVMLYRARMSLRRCLDKKWQNSSFKGHAS